MNPQVKKIIFVFKLVMSLVYIAIGLTFVFSPSSMGNIIPIDYMAVVGLLLISYGVFRGYRAYSIEKQG
jgi:hypothetical protein